MTKKDLSGSARDVTNTRPLRAAEADPAPEQNGKPLSLDYRASTPMPKWVHDVIDESFAIETEDAKKAGALGFMARALVNATLPYKDPKSPIFERRNGHYVLRMMGGNDNGLPYGVYPRLLMSWITTEAVRTGSPELELGESLSSFLRNVLGIQRGGGKRGANARVSEQMERLFSTLITATYTGDKGRSFNLRNVLIVDEAWEAFEDPMVAKFLEGAFRRLRKANASPIVISQSLRDLYNSASGEAIANNAANVLVLRQNAEAIEALKTSGRFNIGEYGYEMLKSLHTEPGQYSEGLFRSGSAWGVGRFVVDRFSQLLYSTMGSEVAALKALRESGMTGAEAIQHYIAVERGEVPPTRAAAMALPAARTGTNR